MKATNLLKRQHRQAERLFKQIQRSKDEGERMELVTQLATALAAHMVIEEQIFYPAAQQVLSGKKALLGETAYLEHMNAKAALQTVVGPGPMSFEARLKVLKELVEHHVEEEEQQMFPELESLIDDAQMKALGLQMQQTFEQMEALGHEGIMAQEMQAQSKEAGSMEEATSSGQDGDGAAAGSKSRANGAKRGTSKASGRSQARA
jgi:hemerythrin superfamily protein